MHLNVPAIPYLHYQLKALELTSGDKFFNSSAFPPKNKRAHKRLTPDMPKKSLRSKLFFRLCAAVNRRRERERREEKYLEMLSVQQHKIESEESFGLEQLFGGWRMLSYNFLIYSRYCLCFGFFSYFFVLLALSRSLHVFFYRRSVYKMEFSSSMSSF